MDGGELAVLHRRVPSSPFFYLQVVLLPHYLCNNLFGQLMVLLPDNLHLYIKSINCFSKKYDNYISSHIAGQISPREQLFSLLTSSPPATVKPKPLELWPIFAIHLSRFKLCLIFVIHLSRFLLHFVFSLHHMVETRQLPRYGRHWQDCLHRANSRPQRRTKVYFSDK